MSKDCSQGNTSPGSTGKMPIIDMPFKRVAVVLVGRITPASDRGHRYILTLVDYATRYPEAVALKSIDTETVAEALVDIYSRLGIPEEVLNDMGPQFVSECMKEVARLLSIKQINTSPYHPICNGLVERFNGSLKKILRRLYCNQPKQWHRYINPLLFAYREVPQEATEFSPFELLYGRTLRGPMQILKELWTSEIEILETKTSYQYVLDLRNRLEATTKLAQKELRKNQIKNKRLYDRKAKRREFKVGDKVLVLLPTSSNKLLMHWRGPYTITKHVASNNYKTNTKNKFKAYHANMLKLYFARSEGSAQNDNLEDNMPVVTATATIEEEETSVEEECLLTLEHLAQSESVDDVKVGQDLTQSQKEDLRNVLQKNNEVFSDLLKRTNVIQHRIKLTEEEPVRSQAYPLPYAVRETLKGEISEMLKLGIIQESDSPYSSPIVLVKKKDGSNRLCVDYRKLNRITETDPKPMNTTKYLFQRMDKSLYFSKIDLSKGYWQISVAEEDVRKTAFVPPTDNMNSEGCRSERRNLELP